jgi:serine/threonine-protein phosphatase 6 regulatory subunit 3
MGHLTLLSQDLITALERYPPTFSAQLRSFLPPEVATEWDAYVSGRFEQTRENERKMLGGGKPVAGGGLGLGAAAGGVGVGGGAGAGKTKWKIDEGEDGGLTLRESASPTVLSPASTAAKNLNLNGIGAIRDRRARGDAGGDDDDEEGGSVLKGEFRRGGNLRRREPSADFGPPTALDRMMLDDDDEVDSKPQVWMGFIFPFVHF